MADNAKDKPDGNPEDAPELSEGYYIDITDEEGNHFQLEIVGEIEYEGALYRVFLPADTDENDPDYGFIILKSRMENGEELLDSVDDDDELDAVYKAFMEELFDDEA